MDEKEGLGNINTKKCEMCGCSKIKWVFRDDFGRTWEKRTRKASSFQYICQNIKCGYHSVLRSIVQCHKCNDTGMVPCSCRKRR